MFGPDDDISRQDLVVILYRFAEFYGVELPSLYEYAGFEDAEAIAAYAAEAVEALFCAGLVNGKPNSLFDPEGNATRAEVAAVLSSYCAAIE